VVTFTRILCPVDLSELSLRPLAYAAAFARWYGARLSVLHVVPTFEPIEVRSGGLVDPVQIVPAPPREAIEREMRRAIHAADAETPGAAVVAEAGDPAATIVDQAVVLPADLIVMGTHGRGGFDRFVLGSVAEKVLRKAPCPVLTVPPHATGAPPSEVLFRRILCPIDFSPASEQALGFALDLARQANGTVTLLHVIEWFTEEARLSFADFDVVAFRRRLAVASRERLAALVAGEPRTWCDINDEVAFGRPHREVIRVAGERASDLIVMGAQGRGGPGLVLLGSTTEQVVRAGTCPVLTVRGAVAS
jgi:nucleotide-binding universal stress UspA family protein